MKKVYQYAVLVALTMVAACTEDDYKLYDTKQKDSVFFEYKNSNGEQIDSVSYAFNYDIAQTHTIQIPVTLMGMPSQHDRPIYIEAVNGAGDMVEGTHYTITNSILPAGKVQALVDINLLRDKDPDIQQRAKKVVFRIKENEVLRAVGNKSFKVIYSDIRPTLRPEWWSEWSPLPVYSYKSAQLFFKYFYELAPKANDKIYKEIVKRYGDYFVNAKERRGPFALYSDFLKQYVLIPLYKDHPSDIEWQSVPEF